MFGVALVFQDPKVMLVAILIIFTHNIVYSLKDFYEKIVFFIFNSTLFIFLIGRMVVVEFLDYNSMFLGTFGLAFVEDYIVMTIVACCYLSLLSIFIGYVLIQRIDLKFLKSKREFSDGYMYSFRLFSLVFFYVCMIFRLYYVYEMQQTARLEGYYESFSTFTSSLPSILITLSSMHDVAFFAYLATNPTKKKSLIPILLYFGEGVLAAIGGRRSIFMLNLLIVFIYFCVRNVRSVEKKEKHWLGKFEWTLSLIAAPILMVFMSIIEKSRSRYSTTKSSGVFDSIFNFFHSQGISANVIGYAKLYENRLPQGRYYTFGPIIEFIDNKIVRPLKGMPALFGQTQERALDGFLFTHTISFIIMPTLYLSGVGYGSSYIAELYTDFSYPGVFIGSIVYGAILYLLFYILKNSNFILVIFALMMTRAIMFAPRAAAMSFIVSSFSMPKILAVVVLLVGARLLQTILGKRRLVFKFN